MAEDLTKLSQDELVKRLEWYGKKHGPYFEKRGLHNFGNLWKKPTWNQWFVMFLLLGLAFTAWAYKHDTQVCFDTIRNLSGEFESSQQSQGSGTLDIKSILNLSGVNINEGQSMDDSGT